MFISGSFIIHEVELKAFSDTVLRHAPNLQSSSVNQILNFESDTTKNKEKNQEKALTPEQIAKNEKFAQEAIMPSMPDLKAKQELGRASWKYFHTLLARFPDKPTLEERNKLETFVTLYAELYPCGECSYHFQKVLAKYPVQTSSRTNAALWGCHVHNIVNEYLKKEIYDCSTVLEDYDCGCGDS